MDLFGRNIAMAALISGTLVVSACAKQEAITEEELQRLPDVQSVTTPVEEPEPVEDAAADETAANGLALQAMAFTETDGVVEAGLGCAFISADDEALFYVDDTANAAVKLNGQVVALKTDGEAGYEAVEQGGSYASEALTVTIDRAEGEGETSGLETTQWPATLNVTQDEGGSRSYEDGRYSCGA